MAFIRMRFQVGGTVFYSRAFEAFAADVEDLSEPLWEVGDVVLEAVGGQFASEGARGGVPWKPLDAEYAIRKDLKWGPSPMLVASGAMRGAMLDKITSMVVTPHRLVYEPDSDIAIYHQEGTEKMVARPMVMLTFEDQRRIDRVFADYVISRRNRMIGAP